MMNCFFLVAIVGFFLVFFSMIETSYGDPQKNVNYYHNYTGTNAPINAQDITHTNSMKWNKDQKEIPYDVPENWNFKSNNLLDYGFTRAWNHTMEDHINQKFKGLPHNWWTGLEVYRIGDIDIASGTYNLEFNYWVQIFEDDDPSEFSTDKPETDLIDFVNIDGEPEMFELTKGIIQKKHYHEITMGGTFYNDFTLKKFPFEKLELKIIAEPNYLGYKEGFKRDSIQLHMWPYPALVEGTSSPGYEIVGYNVAVEDNQYSEGDTYSRYTATYELQRHIPSAFFQFVFPIIIMPVLAFLVMYFPRGEYMTKIELNAIFLLGVVFYVQGVVDEVPQIGTMTVFDFIVIISYAVIVMTILTPGKKWRDEIKFEKDLEDYEWWQNKHEKKIDGQISNIDSDLHNYKLAILLATDEAKKAELIDEKKRRENEKTSLEEGEERLMKLQEIMLEKRKKSIQNKKEIDSFPKLKQVIRIRLQACIRSEELIDKLIELIEELKNSGISDGQFEELIELIEELKNSGISDGQFEELMKLIKELKEFGVRGKNRNFTDWVRLIIEFDDEERSKDRGTTNRQINRYSYAVIGGIVTVGSVFMLILTA